MRFVRGGAAARRPAVPEQPVWHLGRFEDHAQDYAGMVDVILTDPPYGKKALPIYGALATFAQTVLKPGGWLLCMCGNDVSHAVRTLWDATPLEWIADCAYVMLGDAGQADRRTSVGRLTYHWHWKPVLWYQQPGTKACARRGGTRDEWDVEEPKGLDRNSEEFKWQQSLAGFRQIVESHTQHNDVICDPCMGSGTTLLAASAWERRRVIGIECNPVTYATACTKLAPLLPTGAGAQQAAAAAGAQQGTLFAAS
jgi:site-specific DNA-methyltransferase (adenine-specific)